MAERDGIPGIRGYDFDDHTSMPYIPADYDLLGQNPEADMLLLDRISETAYLGGAALFPEREYIFGASTPSNVDSFDNYDEIRAERKALRGEDKNA